MARPDLVPNAPLREAFEASELNAHQLAIRVGLMRRFGTRCRDGEVIREGRWGGDSTAAKRDLGLAEQTGLATGTFRRSINRAKALKYAEALNLLPDDLGL